MMTMLGYGPYSNVPIGGQYPPLGAQYGHHTDMNFNSFNMTQMQQGGSCTSWHSPYGMAPSCARTTFDYEYSPQSVSPHGGPMSSPTSPGLHSQSSELPSPGFPQYKLNMSSVAATATATAVTSVTGQDYNGSLHLGQTSIPGGPSSPDGSDVSQSQIPLGPTPIGRPQQARSPYEWMKKPSYQQVPVVGKFIKYRDAAEG